MIVDEEILVLEYAWINECWSHSIPFH